MLKQLKDKYYKFEEQIKIYNSHKAKLSDEETYNLIDHFLSGSDFWGYSELIATITYELADDSDKYLELLEKINSKVKRDMAQGPFLKVFENIGRNKQSLAIKLYEKILTKSKDNELKVVSGLILGGYSIKNNTTLKKYLSKNIEYPLTNSILKAILLKSESSKLTNDIYSYLDKISKCQDKKILQEFTNICLIFYHKKKSYFYKKIADLVKFKDNNLTYLIFDRLTFQKILNQKQIFELIEYSKDLNDVVIDKIVEVLRKFPKSYKQISKLFIYWLNKDLEFKLRHFDWVLEELVKKNRLFIKYILENYKKIQNKRYKSYITTLPHLFKTLSKFHINYALDQIFKFNLNNKEEKYLFFELNKVIIGNVYQDIKNKDIVIKLINKLIKSSKRRDFIEFNEKKYEEKKSKSSFSREDYDYLIDFADNLLNQLRNRKEKYDFKLINKNLKKYPKLYKFAKEVIKKAKKKKQYTPLIWLGENEQPNFKDIKISEKDSELDKAFKIDFARGRFWPQAYLEELNKDIVIVGEKTNDKFKKKTDLAKDIIKNLSNVNKFWNYFSELIFIGKFKKSYIKAIEPFPPNRQDNNLDLKVHLFKRDVYFEITKPELDRTLRLANGAVTLANKAFSAIDKKYRQLFAKKTLDEIEKGKRKDLFFVVIDKSNSTIDEHQLIDSFLGSLAYTWQIDKTTGKIMNQHMTREKNSLPHKNKNTNIISGAIYFKQELIFINKTPQIILKGDIIPNPQAKNKLNESEIKKLKEIIFQ